MGQLTRPQKVGTFPLELTDTYLIYFLKLSKCLNISCQQAQSLFYIQEVSSVYGPRSRLENGLASTT